MKHIMISIKPEWVEKILNGEKTIEIRKTKPSCDLPVKVYVYCTKDKKYEVAPFRFVEGLKYKRFDDNTHYCCGCSANMGETINGKVMAEFTLNKVTEHLHNYISFEEEECYNFTDKDAQDAGFETDINGLLDFERFIEDYGETKPLYAWHIEDLHIYDTLKELAEFGLKRPFQSWGYLNDK